MPIHNTRAHSEQIRVHQSLHKLISDTQQQQQKKNIQNANLALFQTQFKAKE